MLNKYIEYVKYCIILDYNNISKIQMFLITLHNNEKRERKFWRNFRELFSPPRGLSKISSNGDLEKSSCSDCTCSTDALNRNNRTAISNRHSGHDKPLLPLCGPSRNCNNPSISTTLPVGRYFVNVYVISPLIFTISNINSSFIKTASELVCSLG